MKFQVIESIEVEVDSEGNPLSPEQVAFFKDSKVRDSHGRLLVCYHGSRSSFDSFDREKSKNGFFFSTKERKKQVADYYSDYGKGNVYKCYLNIVNPYYVKRHLQRT